MCPNPACEFSWSREKREKLCRAVTLKCPDPRPDECYRDFATTIGQCLSGELSPRPRPIPAWMLCFSVEELFKFNGGLHSAFSPKNRNQFSRTLPSFDDEMVTTLVHENMKQSVDYLYTHPSATPARRRSSAHERRLREQAH